MLHAPTSETKTETSHGTSPLSAQTEPRRALHPSTFRVTNLHALNSTGDMATARSLALQRRQTLTDMQSTHGNQAVLRMLHIPQQGARMPALRPSQGMMLQRKYSCCGIPGPTGECAECKAKQEGALQRSVGDQMTPSDGKTVPAIVHDVLSSSGQLLDTGTRAFMEPRFGHDFSHVRVHTDARAAESARAVNALAYTVGKDVVFGRGQYTPETSEGRRLMAHELTHVVQQQRGGHLSLQRLADDDTEDINTEDVVFEEDISDDTALEEEADLTSQGVLLAGPIPKHSAPKKKKPPRKKKPDRLPIDQVKSLIASNNKSTVVSNELLLCLIWKESSFNPNEKSKASSATGLMQMTRGAVEEVNKNTPKGIHFKHSEMTNPSRNIDCGTRYLDMRIKQAGGDLKKGLEGFGTGSGYADDILTCETCLQGKPATTESCLTPIHS